MAKLRRLIAKGIGLSGHGTFEGPGPIPRTLSRIAECRDRLFLCEPALPPASTAQSGTGRCGFRKKKDEGRGNCDSILKIVVSTSS